MALERAPSDVPGFTPEERTVIDADPSAIAHPGRHAPEPAIPVVDLRVLEDQTDLWGRLDAWASRCIDILVASLMLVLFSPALVVIWLLIRVTSPGQAVYRHKRVGRHGAIFECVKFRTMVMDADELLEEMLSSDPELREEFNRNHKLKDDPRITSIGRFLRKTSLDEMPQFWNVLKGEMSVVGPRPIVEEEKVKYGADLDIVLSVRPGITGLWQISGRNDLSYERRVALDRRYALTRSILLDLYVMMRTPAAALKPGNGAY